jgi:FkbM family methyltransferase
MSLQLIEFENRKFYVSPNSKLEEDFWNLYSSKKWEYDYLLFMLANRNGKVFLDIGSWIGPVSLLMASCYEKVVSIDFDPVANESFKQNLLINQIMNVDLCEIGFSDRREKVKVSTDTLGSSMTSLFGNLNHKTVEVDVLRFDSFIKQCSYENDIGFIKIDCEGAEYKFLDQIYKFLDEHPVKVLVSYHPFVLKKPVYYFIKVYHWLMQIRFKRYYFKKNGGVIIKRPYRPLFRLSDNIPMADVLES